MLRFRAHGLFDVLRCNIAEYSTTFLQVDRPLHLNSKHHISLSLISNRKRSNIMVSPSTFRMVHLTILSPNPTREKGTEASAIRIEYKLHLQLHLMLTHVLLDEGFRNTRLYPRNPNLHRRYHWLRSHRLCPIDRSWPDRWSSGQFPSSLQGHSLMGIWRARCGVCRKEHGTD